MFIMGFGDKWRGWMMECISTARAVVIINGSSSKEFSFHRALPQGDPLSPFLFILVTEALHLALDSVVEMGLIKGFKNIISGLKFSHLQFADDTILFLKADDNKVSNMKYILRCFEIFSGVDSFYWKIGNGKSALFWWDNWCRDRPLKLIYPRLFHLAKSKDCTVAEVVCMLGNGSSSWNEYFTRPLLDREQGLCKELAERVNGTVLNLNIEDRLCWAKDKGGDFLVKKCTKLLMLDDGENNMFDCGAVIANNAKEAEIGAGKIALEVFLAMNWKPKDSLYIEIGSLVAFSWCVNKALRPWSLLSVFAEIEIAMLKVGNVVFSLADRKGNSMAFSLVMAGVNRMQIFKAWW
ncbi:hypothetical protein PVK06_041531 [Gossypium arboreum]|uniref:Reverse transcriptase domain-containing protein n=1 Tax=Gossypium arboreum TaxID=29729 RepID=A0ABR0N9B8_GOSAR|nr:hypothetical protein PVK06_041531 [Gossypium arboreum]